VQVSRAHTPEAADERALPEEPGKEEANPVTGAGDP
jgi:hypothetical protein